MAKIASDTSGGTRCVIRGRDGAQRRDDRVRQHARTLANEKIGLNAGKIDAGVFISEFDELDGLGGDNGPAVRAECAMQASPNGRRIKQRGIRRPICLCPSKRPDRIDGYGIANRGLKLGRLACVFDHGVDRHTALEHECDHLGLSQKALDLITVPKIPFEYADAIGIGTRIERLDAIDLTGRQQEFDIAKVVGGDAVGHHILDASPADAGVDDLTHNRR